MARNTHCAMCSYSKLYKAMEKIHTYFATKSDHLTLYLSVPLLLY